MKPLSLVMQAFGPYASRQEIDFAHLADKGMFLIKGPTGSGKTTIFDAMMFALYGGGSGEDDKVRSGRNDLEEWRCSQAEATVPTIVSFTFSVHERTYVFTRSLIQKRVNLSPLYEAGEVTEEGNVIPFFNNPKKEDLNKKAVELIGLTKEQFRQVVLLPQGQFERFLVAPSAEKEEILQKIFETQNWGRYVQRFFDRAQAKKQQLDAEKDEIIRSLAEENAPTLQDLIQQVEEMKKELAKIEEDHAAFDGEKKQEILNKDMQLYEPFKELHQVEKNLSALELKKDQIQGKKKEADAADKAEGLREIINNCDRAKKEAQQRETALKRASLKVPQVKENWDKVAKTLQKEEQDSPVAALQTTIGEYESRKATYQELEEKKKAYAVKYEKYQQAKKESDRKEALFTTMQNSSTRAFTVFESESKLAADYRRRYYAEIYGEIAMELKEEEPCPVCGSIHHPSPAVKSPDSISKKQMEDQEAAAQKAERDWKKKEEERLISEKEAKEAQEELQKIKAEAIEAQAAYKAAMENRIHGIDCAEQLEKEIQKLQQQILGYTDRLGQLKKLVEKAQASYTEAATEEAKAKEEAASAARKAEDVGAEMQQALTTFGYESLEKVQMDLRSQEERHALRQSVMAYDQEYKVLTETLEKKKEALKDQTEPDVALFTKRQMEINEEGRSYNTNSARLKTSIQRLDKKTRELSKKADHYHSNIHEAGNDLKFAKALRGDTGMGLQRYVLAIMFNQVIGEANRMLTKVHGGRYHLFRSDERVSGNKRGLELKVHDNRSPEKEGRSVAMLSGGEKFLVSLALSIGMSTVAQKSGVQIEALFIDEGFGTLDDRSIQDAMEVLDSVQKTSGMIGIISHVQLLEDNITTHLEVIKEESGSRIVLR